MSLFCTRHFIQNKTIVHQFTIISTTSYKNTYGSIQSQTIIMFEFVVFSLYIWLSICPFIFFLASVFLSFSSTSSVFPPFISFLRAFVLYSFDFTSSEHGRATFPFPNQRKLFRPSVLKCLSVTKKFGHVGIVVVSCGLTIAHWSTRNGQYPDIYSKKS